VTEAELQERVKDLPIPALKALYKRMAWLKTAHDYQVPERDSLWDSTHIYLLLAGRGAGKTRAAAEWLWWQAWTQPGTRWLISAPTAGDVRDVAFSGDSGILNVMPKELVKNHMITTSEIILINDSIIKGIPASEPERFRGPQFHGGWLDELAAWERLDEAWSQIQFGMRLGKHPRLMCTTTPRPKPLIFDLVERDGHDVCYVSATTYDNLDNLAPTFKAQILQYEGTELGDQEINAVLLDPSDHGLIKREWFKLWPAERSLPQFTMVIQSYDTATSEKTVNDATACVVLGVFKPQDGPTCCMIIDAWSERIQYPDLRIKVTEAYQDVYGDPDEFGSGKKTDVVLIEDKSAGISLIQDLQRAGLPVRGYNPGNADKVTRANLVAPIIAHRRVYIPESDRNPGTPRSWLSEAMNQWTAFPEVRHDDYVDALTQALRYLKDSGIIRIDPVDDGNDYYADDDRRRVNPYAQ
jgi:predicted phage terminase large subunit-like protein